MYACINKLNMFYLAILVSLQFFFSTAYTHFKNFAFFFKKKTLHANPRIAHTNFQHFAIILLPVRFVDLCVCYST